MENETCKTCRNYNPLSDDHGKCRQSPPSASLIPVHGIGGQSLSVVSYWPEVKADDWCGYYSASFQNLTAPLKLV